MQRFVATKKTVGLAWWAQASIRFHDSTQPSRRCAGTAGELLETMEGFIFFGGDGSAA